VWGSNPGLACCALDLQLQDDLNEMAKWEKTWGMEFHPEKCNILSITRSRTPKSFKYKLKGHVLERTTSAKYLGVTITSDLSWKTHIDKTTKKANSVLGFLRRNLKTPNPETKAMAYKTLVRPHLEYCCSTWNAYRKEDVKTLEMVQRRAARYATNRYHNTSSVTSMLDGLGWETLESRRQKHQLTLFYKVVNNLVDIPASRYLTPSNSRTRTNHSKKFQQFSAKCDYYKFSFFPRTVPVWNSLPAQIAESPDLVSFRQGLLSLSF